MAVKNGWITSERKKFEPNRAVSRIEFVTVLARISGEKLSPGIRRRWTDLNWNDPLQKYAQFGAEMNLIDGVDGKKFNPNKPLTRAEAAEAVYRYLKAKNKL